MDEHDMPTRAEIKEQLDTVTNFPGNRGLAKAAMRLKHQERLDTFLQGRGLGVRQIRSIASDIESYYPENFSNSGRQV